MKFEAGDILFSNIRTYFRKVWRAKFAGTCSPDVLVMRPKNTSKLDGKYLHHICRWKVFTEFSVRTSKGVKMPRGDKDALGTFLFQLPEITEQNAISKVIDSIDERIDHNRALAANLEAIARRLFKSWFVDFDPVRAKAAGGKPAGLTDDIAALFPEQFVSSELFGEIPDGWNTGTLSDICKLNPESWTAKKHPDVLRYIDLSNVKSGSIEETTLYQWEKSPSRARRVLSSGDTIVGTVRPGNRSFALIDTDGLTCSTGFAVLRPCHRHQREYLYLAATADDEIDRLAHLADGAAYPAVRPDVVTDAKVVIPNDDVLKQFSIITSPLFEQIAICHEEVLVLSSLRECLLLLLISGKLPIEDAESVIEEAIA